MKIQTRHQPKDSTLLDLYLEDLVLGLAVVAVLLRGSDLRPRNPVFPSPSRCHWAASFGESSMSKPGPLVMKLEELSTMYLTTLGARGYSPRTLKTYKANLKLLRRYFGTRSELRNLGDIGPRELEDFAAWLVTTGGEKARAARGRANVMATTRMFFEYLMKTGISLMNPASTLAGVRVDKRLPAVATIDEVLRLLAAIDTKTPFGKRDRAVVELLYGIGLRISELLGLDLEDIDLAEGLVMVRRGKGGKERLLPLPEETRRALLEYLEFGRPKMAAAR